MAWEENKHPRDKSGQFTSKGNEGQGGKEDKTEYKGAKIEKLTKFNGEEVYQFETEDGDVLTFKSLDEAKEYVDKNHDDFDSDNDFESWEPEDDQSRAVFAAEDELGINALDSYENYEQVCDWLIANEYAEDYNAADKMIKDSLSPEGWEKLNKIREEWGIEDLEDNFDIDKNRYTPLEKMQKLDGSTVFQTADKETGDVLTFKSKEQARDYFNDKEVDEEDNFDLDEDFVENIDNIDYDKADKNELINKNKAKNPNRKDKYGNELISDEAFKIGTAGVNKYLDFMKQYYDYDKLKQSNIFLEGLQNAASKAITENGYDPNSDMTNQDFNEIIGAALGDEIDIERNKFTGKKYNGYKPKGL